MTADLLPVMWDGDDVLVYVPAPYEFEMVVPDGDRTVVLDVGSYEHEVSS